MKVEKPDYTPPKEKSWGLRSVNLILSYFIKFNFPILRNQNCFSNTFTYPISKQGARAALQRNGGRKTQIFSIRLRKCNKESKIKNITMQGFSFRGWVLWVPPSHNPYAFSLFCPLWSCPSFRPSSWCRPFDGCPGRDTPRPQCGLLHCSLSFQKQFHRVFWLAQYPRTKCYLWLFRESPASWFPLWFRNCCEKQRTPHRFWPRFPFGVGQTVPAFMVPVPACGWESTYSCRGGTSCIRWPPWHRCWPRAPGYLHRPPTNCWRGSVSW